MESPYRAEYAKSGRAKCKGCKGQIEQNTLRLAVMVQSPMFDGKVPNWYHFHCFFLKQRVKNVGDISHFESLRWEDQEKIQKKISESSSSNKVSNDSDSKKSKKSTKSNKRKNNSLDDFIVEYSKSSRASCRGCEEKIVKQEVRAAKKDYDSEDARKYGGIPLWHHLECFSKLRNELEFWESGSELPGFKNLKKEDQENVMKLLPQIKPVKIKKEESDTVDGAKPAKQPKIEDNSIIKNQNKEIFKYRDQLTQLKKKELDLLMEYNGQDIATGTETKLDRLSDAMVFGTLLPCKECKDGQLVFRSGVGYYCLGNKDEWVKCESVTLDPERKSFKIPKELKEKYSFLNAYKYKSQKRVMQNIAPSISVESVASTSYAIKSMMKSEPSTSPAGYDIEKRGTKSKIKIMFNRPKIQRSLPLKNMEFYAIGRKMPIEKEVLRCEILKLGGTLSSKMHSNITAVLATKEQVNSNSKILDKAEENGIQVVPFEFIEECKKPGSNAVSNINKMNLVSWGDDPTNRMESTVTHSKSKSISGKYKSNLPSKVKLKVKHGAAVDPDSGLEDVTQVYKFGKDIYNTTLSLTDLQSGRNSYYKLQVLESLDKKSYWLFRSWGRIGTTIGSTKLEKKRSREEAVEEFQALFEEKTGNMWSGRHNFRKIPLKMVMVDISYEDEKFSTAEGEVPSKLEKPVQNLISLIFNVDAMKNVMLEFELDLEKMPLGKLSKKQIQEAFKVLGSIQEFLSASDGISNVQTLVGFTNRFYTLIPHDFGIENPPLINTIEAIRQKSEMLDTLLELEIAYSILSNSESGKVMHHIDNYYLKLQADISVLDKSSPEFKTFELYVKNTHAETHRTYDLEIMDIFKVNRSGESKRYKPFKKIQNRQLLWHGSRTTNFAGIISQGLRIAPPEAPVTGYMFGKGIYFADMVSKSANYCMTNATNNVGLVLLCEVALGEMCECTRAETFVKPPKGKNSVKGVGMTEPDPKDTITREDGVQIPLGKGVRCEDRQTSLLYNEYIVYDVAQVKVEYLVQLKFNYK